MALTPVRACCWRVVDCLSEVSAAEALVDEGRWRRVGSVMDERVYERPCKEMHQLMLSGVSGVSGEGALTVSRPTEMEPTNFNVDTVLAAIFPNGPFFL